MAVSNLMSTMVRIELPKTRSGLPLRDRVPELLDQLIPEQHVGNRAEAFREAEGPALRQGNNRGERVESIDIDLWWYS